MELRRNWHLHRKARSQPY